MGQGGGVRVRMDFTKTLYLCLKFPIFFKGKDEKREDKTPKVCWPMWQIPPQGLTLRRPTEVRGPGGRGRRGGTVDGEPERLVRVLKMCVKQRNQFC